MIIMLFIAKAFCENVPSENYKLHTNFVSYKYYELCVHMYSMLLFKSCKYLIFYITASYLIIIG